MELFFTLMDRFNGLLWHPVVLLILMFVGLLFTLWTRFGQTLALNHGVAVVRGKFDDHADPGAISHFQALSAALSATVGLGNIAGVAIAVSLGGPGAVFWMWVVGFLGMALKMTEVIQSMLYRDVSQPEEPHGGPMYVVRKGLEARGWTKTGVFLGGLFCLTLLASTVTGGNMFQAWNVAEISFSYFGMPKLATGAILFVLVTLVVVGGIKRIGSVAEKLVPMMCGLYILAAFAVLFHFRAEIPGVLVLIVQSALPTWLGGSAPQPVGAFLGGTAGYAFLKGMQRALFSNEAGQGSAPIAHSAAKTSEPVREGVVAGLEPFIDTLCICTMTAMVILLSGVWKRPADLVFDAQPAWVEMDPGSWTLEPLPLPDDFQAKAGATVYAIVQTSTEKVTYQKLTGIIRQDDADQAVIDWDAIRAEQPPSLKSDGLFVEFKGATLTAKAFDKTWPGLGKWIVPICVWLFALSTMISWSYYGEQGATYLFGEKSVTPYRWIYCILIPVACSPLIATETQLDIISTLGTGLMLWVNIPIMLIFGKETMTAFANYKAKLRRGEFNPDRNSSS